MALGMLMGLSAEGPGPAAVCAAGGGDDCVAAIAGAAVAAVAAAGAAMGPSSLPAAALITTAAAAASDGRSKPPPGSCWGPTAPPRVLCWQAGTGGMCTAQHGLLPGPGGRPAADLTQVMLEDGRTRHRRSGCASHMPYLVLTSASGSLRSASYAGRFPSGSARACKQQTQQRRVTAAHIVSGPDTRRLDGKDCAPWSTWIACHTRIP
jgi:hypothetical protein